MTQNVVPVRNRRVVSPALIEAMEDRRLLSATISVSNLDAVAGSANVAFNRIQIPNPNVNDVVHDTNTLRISNTGNQPLVISSLTLSDTTNWQLVNPPTSSALTVAPGRSVDVTVRFVAQSAPSNQPANETNDVTSTDSLPPAQTGGVYNATLSIVTNDPNAATTTEQLAGYWQYESEHEEEPNLQTIVNRLFGYGTNISSTPLPDYPNSGSTVVPYGEEVLTGGLFQAANPSQPVNVLQLAAYHTQDNPSDPSTLLSQVTTYYYPSNPSNYQPLFSHQKGEGQSLLPHIANSSSAPAQGSFSPGKNSFGFDLDGEYSQDSLNTTDINSFGRSGHAIRFYPARDSSGNLIPNTWIMAMDYQNAQYDNSDYQDGVWLVSNLRPTTQAPAVTNLQASSSAGKVTLQWTAAQDSSLQGYNVYRSETPGGTFTKLNASPISGTSYADASPPASTEYYQVSAVDSSGESEKASTAIAVSSSSSSGGGGTPGNGPDLTVTTVAGKFGRSVVGNSASGPARVTIANSGNQTAKGTIQITEFLSTNSDSVSAGAPQVATVKRNVNLKAGKSTVVAVPGFKYPSNLSGQYFVVAQVTDVKGITESDTSNNTGASAAVNIAAPFVDLHNLFTGPLPSTLTPGKHTTLQVPVINDGNIAAHGVATITISASTSSSGANATTLTTIKRPIAIGAGKTAKLAVPFLVPTLPSGTYFVVTTVSLAADTNAANNTGISSGTFAV